MRELKGLIEEWARDVRARKRANLSSGDPDEGLDSYYHGMLAAYSHVLIRL